MTLTVSVLDFHRTLGRVSVAFNKQSNTTEAGRRYTLNLVYLALTMCFDGNDCGFFGNCIDNICECDQGWKNSYDSLLHISSEVLINDTEFSRLPCTEHEVAIRIIYAGASLLAIVAIIDLVRSLKRKSQVKRAFPGILALLGAAILGIYRNVATGRGNVLGSDPLINIIVGVSFPLMALRSLVFVNKYITYQMKLINKTDTESLKAYIFNRLVIFFSIANIFILLTALFYRKEGVTRVNIFRLGLGIGIFMSVWVITVSYLQFTFFIKQLKDLSTTWLEDEDKALLIKYFTGIKWTICMIYIIFIGFALVSAASIRTLRLMLWLLPFVIYLLILGELVLNNLVRRATCVYKKRVNIVKSDQL